MNVLKELNDYIMYEIPTCDKTETLPRKDSFFDTRSLRGEVGADVVLLPGLPVISEPV